MTPERSYTQHPTTRRKDAVSTQSTRAKGLNYQNKTLHLLARLGYATTRQIARGVWGKVTPSTRKMATRTLNTLLETGLLVERREDVNSDRLVALTKAGVQRLRTVVSFGLVNGRQHARDWLRHAHDHRTACNSVFVSAAAYAYDESMERDDWLGLTELEIRGDNQTLLHEAWCDYRSEDNEDERKIADGVVYRAGKPIWIEVENCDRGTGDMRKCVDWLRAMYAKRKPEAEQVWFVITAPGAARIGRRLKAALTPGDFVSDARPRQAKELDERILREHRVRVFSLDADTLELTELPL